MIHTIQNNFLTVQVKNAGAELCSIKDKAGTEYLFDANPAYWGRSAPVLFPFVGSLKNKSFVYEGKSYQMGQHGFARDRDFSLLQKEEASIWFRLTSNEETLAIYPLPFVLDIGYQLEDNSIRVLWNVHNPSDKSLLFSIGAHPAFLCPPCGGGMDGCYLGFDLSPSLFDRDALIVEGKQAGRVWLADREKKPFVTVEFNAPLFGIWSPAGKNAPFVCIEPWYGRCDAEDFSGDLTQREYGNCISPGQIFQENYCIQIGQK